MAKRWKKVAIMATALMMASSMALGFTGCDDDQGNTPTPTPTPTPTATPSATPTPGTDPNPTPAPVEQTGWRDPKNYTYRDYTSQLPDVWNIILTQDATNSSMASYLGSSFYEYDYKYDEKGEIVPGAFTIKYSAATKLEDVTAKYVGKYGITQEDADEGHHAFAITLRTDLTWDDGTAIKAEDFVYTMSQQLSPNYLFATASNYYSGNYVIHNSQEYVYQGQTKFTSVTNGGSKYWDTAVDADGIYHLETVDGAVVKAILTEDSDWSSDSVQDYANAGYLGAEGKDIINKYATQADENGAVPLTEELKTLLENFCLNYGGGYANEWQEFCGYTRIYKEMDFSEVGFFVGANEYELVFVTDTALSPLDDEGNLTYEAAYYLQDFPLVKKDLWQKCEDTSTTPYTNTYCSASVENSASWGPYKVSNYQSGVTYTLSRNEKWYGYGMEQYEGQFQMDEMVTRYVPEWNTAWQLFQQGEIDGVGMDVTIASDYRDSSRAYFTPETYTYSLNLQSLNFVNNPGERNNVLLKYDSFRKAISLSLDRDDYCAKNSPASQAALAYVNQMYYYDVENGLIYRETEVAKEAILNAYGATQTDKGWKVGTVVYDDIDDALDALTGYNVSMARELVTQAYNEAVAAGDYKDGDEIILTYGIATQNSSTDRVKNWFQESFDNMVKGTPLEGKIRIEYFMFSTATWTKQFKNGEFDLMFSAWGQAAFNPYYLFGETQIGEGNRYALGWKPESIDVTLTLSDGKTYTLNLNEWNDSVQGKSGAPYNFSIYPNEDKLAILAAEEAEVLQAYWAIPVYSSYTSSLMGYKVDYYSYDYNTFMGYGGIQYMTFNYDDEGWDAYVKAQGGTLSYK